jgi:hypothetical protein
VVAGVLPLLDVFVVVVSEILGHELFDGESVELVPGVLEYLVSVLAGPFDLPILLRNETGSLAAEELETDLFE